VPDRSVGTLLVVAGLALAFIGALVWAGVFSWLGRLPGDIRVERPGTRVYVPITSMIIVSILLTAVLSIARRFWP